MSTVKIEDRDGGVRILTMDRPPANAIAPELMEDMEVALADAKTDDSVRALVVTGAGRFFSAGLDLRQTTNPDDLGALLQERGRTVWLDLLTFPKPTVGMLQGHAIAGGIVTLLACDYRLGAEGDYKVGLNEIAIGAAFPVVAFEIVRLRLSHQQACEMVLGANIYPASEAVRLGVVEELLPANGFEDAVVSRAAKIGAYPSDAYAYAKAALLEDTVARVKAETKEQGEAMTAVWLSQESMAARLAQAQSIGKG